MRSTLQSFRVVNHDRTCALVDELRWLGGQLGGARDLEVQEQRIGAAVAALPPELVMGPVAAEVTRFFARRRADAARGADDALNSDRYLSVGCRPDRERQERLGAPAGSLTVSSGARSRRRTERRIARVVPAPVR